MNLVFDLRSFLDMLSFVATYGPDRFPEENGEQLDLESAFTELRKGIQYVKPHVCGQPAEPVEEILNQSEQDFRDNKVDSASSALVKLASELEKGGD